PGIPNVAQFPVFNEAWKAAFAGMLVATRRPGGDVVRAVRNLHCASPAAGPGRGTGRQLSHPASKPP
ncbi:MAG: hypothetical protein ABIV36_05515, partial [Sphingobium limneticum]